MKNEQAYNDHRMEPFCEDVTILRKAVDIGKKRAPNAIVIHPMEGADGEASGTPSDLTIRRYDRFATGGAGLIWFEAVAVCHEGKANPRQLMMDASNVSHYEELLQRIKREASAQYGAAFEPLVVMQLTHSGRFCRPFDKPAPVLAWETPCLDQKFSVQPFDHIITDEALEKLQELFVQKAVLAQKAGFDGVDIKSCHRYLISSLLAAHQRTGRYGGSFEARTRFLVETIERVKQATSPDFIVTLRLNVYDGIAYPYGFGMSQDGSLTPNYEEPIRLLKILEAKGVEMVNITMGTPYYNPHVNRPYDSGDYEPPETPKQGVQRLLEGTGAIKQQLKHMKVVATGMTWLRHFAANVAAGLLQSGWADMVGFGRQAFSYPTFAADLLQKGHMLPNKCCITCGKCSQLMRADCVTGCVVKDASVYASIYKKAGL